MTPLSSNASRSASAPGWMQPLRSAAPPMVAGVSVAIRIASDQSAPATIGGVADRKGCIQPGADADLLKIGKIDPANFSGIDEARTQAALVAFGAVVGNARLESLASSFKILLKTLLQSA